MVTLLVSDSTVFRGKGIPGHLGSLNLCQETGCLDWGLWYYSSVSSGKFQDINSISQRQLPSKSFLIQSSPNILSFNSIQTKMLTVSNICILKQQWPACLKMYLVCNEFHTQMGNRKHKLSLDKLQKRPRQKHNENINRV